MTHRATIAAPICPKCNDGYLKFLSGRDIWHCVNVTCEYEMTITELAEKLNSPARSLAGEAERAQPDDEAEMKNAMAFLKSHSVNGYISFVAVAGYLVLYKQSLAVSTPPCDTFKPREGMIRPTICQSCGQPHPAALSPAQAAEPVHIQQDGLEPKCTCPEKLYDLGSSEPNDSFCRLSEEEHEALREAAELAAAPECSLCKGLESDFLHDATFFPFSTHDADDYHAFAAPFSPTSASGNEPLHTCGGWDSAHICEACQAEKDGAASASQAEGGQGRDFIGEIASLALQITNLNRLLALYRQKRSADGMNGRKWDASEHLKAELEIQVEENIIVKLAAHPVSSPEKGRDLI